MHGSQRGPADYLLSNFVTAVSLLLKCSITYSWNVNMSARELAALSMPSDWGWGGHTVQHALTKRTTTSHVNDVSSCDIILGAASGRISIYTTLWWNTCQTISASGLNDQIIIRFVGHTFVFDFCPLVIWSPILKPSVNRVLETKHLKVLPSFTIHTHFYNNGSCYRRPSSTGAT